jgi:DNA-binding PadR family transcriptional regulator
MSPVFGHGRLRLYLLKLVAEQPRHGYEIIRLLEDHFGGMYAPSAGTIYPRLARLEAEEMVTHARERGRKVYRITEAGRAELARRQDELAAIEDELDDSAASLTDIAHEIQQNVRDTVQGLKFDLRLAKADLKRDLEHGIRQDLTQAALDIAAHRFGVARSRRRSRGGDRPHPGPEHAGHVRPGTEHPDEPWEGMDDDGEREADGWPGAARSRAGAPGGASPPGADAGQEAGRGPRGFDDDAHGGLRDERFERLLAEFRKQARRVAGSRGRPPTEAQLGECVAILDEALDRLSAAFDREAP